MVTVQSRISGQKILFLNRFFLKLVNFPGGPVVKNPAANAGDMGSIPGPGKISCAPEQLSPCAIATEQTL